MSAGEFFTLYEIFEITVSIVLLLVISIAIGIATNPDMMQANAQATEIGYTSSLVSDTNFIININYENTEISNKENQNKIILEYDENTIEKEYYGTGIQITKLDDNSHQLISN